MTRANAHDLRRRIKRRVDGLSAARLPLAEDFLAYLQDRERDPATAELLRIPGLVQRLRRAERDAAQGRVTPSSALKRKT